MDFVERVFGISPDGGSGSLELLVYMIPVAALLIVCRARFRRAAEGDTKRPLGHGRTEWLSNVEAAHAGTPRASGWDAAKAAVYVALSRRTVSVVGELGKCYRHLGYDPGRRRFDDCVRSQLPRD